MSSLIFILRRSLINNIKELLKKPGILIVYVIIGLLMITSAIVSGRTEPAEHIALDPNIVKAIFTGYILFICTFSLAASLGGGSYFRMADVNFLFTAPLNAGSILIYGFVKQMAANILVMVFISLQYPNWKRMFGFLNGAGWLLIFAYILLIAFTSLLGMVLYSWALRKPGRKKIIRSLIYAAIILILLPIPVQTIRTGDLLKSTVDWLSSGDFKYVPVIGWFSAVFQGAVTGIDINVLLNASYLLIASVTAFIYLYRMDTDYFEDALSGTELKEAMLTSVREGKTTAVSIRRYRKVNYRIRLEGSMAIFQKQMLEKRKTGIWLVSARSLLFLAGGLIAAFALPLENVLILTILLGVYAYFMMIITMAGPWEGELSSHYIYLIPAPPLNKMFASTLPGILKLLVEGTLIFGITGIVLKVHPLVILTIIGVYVSTGGVFTYFDIILRRLFGRMHSNNLRVFFRIFLSFVLLAVAAVPASIIIALTQNYALGFLAAAIINTFLSFLFMLLGVGVFSNPELS
jgi:hypothetical protein